MNIQPKQNLATQRLEPRLLEHHSACETVFAPIWLEETRLVPKKSKGSFRGKYTDPKTGLRHIGESLNEHGLCFHAAFDPTVKHFVSHPCTFGYINRHGKESKYSPDKLLIRQDDQWVFVEVKPEDKIYNIDFYNDFRYLRGLLHSIGCHLILTVDTVIRREPFLSNLKFISGYAKLIVTEVQCQSLLDFVFYNQGCSLSEALKHCQALGVTPAIVYFLLHHRRLFCDMETIIDRPTALFHPDRMEA
jgi:hypothetical protein